MLVKSKYLVFPVNKNGTKKRVDFLVDGKRVLYMNIRLDNINPDFEAYVDVSKYMGMELEFTVTPEMPLNYEERDEYKVSGAYSEAYRPQVHFSPESGWNNDPNGLFYLNGKYHLFYQHNPCDPMWENMSWGHAVSNDLMHWENKDIALFPDEFGTMYSGSAMVDTDNLLGKQEGDIPTVVLYYTAAAQAHTERKKYSQCMAYSVDGGETFTKCENNPVIDHIVGGNRDPKIVYSPELKCYLLALYLDGDDYAIFKTVDLVNFKEWFRFTAKGENECPDIFRIKADDGKYKWVFIGAHDVYISGEIIDGEFVPDGGFKKLHNGSWYASQTYSDAPDKRRIRIEWMRWGGFMEKNFSQQMGIPTEITLKNINNEYYLSALPVKELEALYKTEDVYKALTLEENGKTQINVGTDPIYYEIKADYKEDGILKINNFGMNFTLNFKDNEINLNGIKSKISLNRETLNIKVLVDRASIEIFLDGGIYCVTNAGTFSGNSLMDRNLPYIELESNKEITLDEIKINTLKSIW